MILLGCLQAYPAPLQDQVRRLVAESRLDEYLRHRYPGHRDVQSDKTLYTYTMSLKQEHLRNASGLDKVLYDNKLDVARRTLGLHTVISRVQSGRFKAKKEIRVAPLFRDAVPEFLRVIAVHELAHLKESKHSKTFYQLYQYVLSDYHQLEFDLRVYLTWKSL